MATIITSAMVWNIGNVVSFNGYDVDNGNVKMTDEEYESFLDDIYPQVEVAGHSWGAGGVLKEMCPYDFDMGKSEEESRIQDELQDQLDKEKESGITFGEYDPCDINEDDEEDEE